MGVVAGLGIMGTLGSIGGGLAAAAPTIGALGSAAGAGMGIFNALTQKQANIGGAGSDVYGTKIQAPTFAPYNPLGGVQDYQKMMPGLEKVAGGFTQYGIGQRNMVMPGASDLMGLGSTNLQQMAQGQVPLDVQNATARGVASQFGGAYSPIAGGFGTSQAQNAFSRNLGQTSQQQMMQGMSMAPTWENLAQSFTYKPQDALQGAMGMLGQREQYNQSAYEAALNTAKIGAAPDPVAAGQYNDLRLQQALQTLKGQPPGLQGAFSQLPTMAKGLQGLFPNQAGTHNAMTGSYTDLSAQGHGGQYPEL